MLKKLQRNLCSPTNILSYSNILICTSFVGENICETRYLFAAICQQNIYHQPTCGSIYVCSSKVNIWSKSSDENLLQTHSRNWIASFLHQEISLGLISEIRQGPDRRDCKHLIRLCRKKETTQARWALVFFKTFLSWYVKLFRTMLHQNNFLLKRMIQSTWRREQRTMKL